MTLQEIADRIKKIKGLAHDPEVAHCEEDDLWADVLREIANGCTNPSGYAREALKTKSIEFPRWCA